MPLRSAAGLELRTLRVRTAAASSQAARVVRLPTELVVRRPFATSTLRRTAQEAVKPADAEPYRPSVRHLKLEGQAIVTEGAFHSSCRSRPRVAILTACAFALSDRS